MTRIRAISLAVAVLVALAVGCAREDSKPIDLTDEERQWLQQHRGAIRLSPCPDFPPIDFQGRDGAHRGLTADYLAWIEKKLNYRFIIEHQRDWFTVMQKAKAREIDGVLTIQEVPERREYLLFTRPYVRIPNIIVTRSTHSGDLTPEALAGMKVSSVRGYAVTDYLTTKYPALVLDHVPNELMGLMKVSFSQSDAMIVSLSTASYFIEEKGITNLRVAGAVGYDWDLRIAVRKDLPVLQGILDKTLASMPQDMRTEIYRRWIRLGSHSVFDNPYLRIALGAAVLIAMLVFLGIIAWNRMLRRQVMDRTAELSRELAERTRAEQALSQEKERLLITLRSIGDGFISTDTNGRVVLMNRIAEELTGVEVRDALGADVAQVCRIVDRESGQAQELPVARCIAQGRVVILSDEIVLVSRGGERRDVMLSISPIRDADANTLGTVMVFRDITERRRMREELNKVQRLESLGLLAGGIAHDFNNILTAILGNASLAAHELKAGQGLADEAPAIRLLGDIARASKRAKNLTFQLLTFARGGDPVRRTGDIDRVLEDSVNFALRGTNVRASFVIAGDLRPVDFDEGQMSQVFNNLAINAQQAMPEGGEITVCAENRHVEWGGGLSWRPGEYVVISVSDSGGGIREEDLSKIFDPYYTTKDNGTGLGLTSAYSIVKQHDGYITAKSSPGSGATFTIYVPPSHASTTDVDAPEEGGALHRASGRILVMDDEEPIRQLARRMLEFLGYEVETASGGDEALARYRESREAGSPFDAVILDLTVPGGMGGRETLQRIRELDPGVKAIVSSGYSHDQVLSSFQEHGFRAVIAKPYRMEELSRVVFDVIRG